MFREWILLLSSSLSAGYSVENAFGQSLHELHLMFPRGGLMLDELRNMLAKAENNQSPESLLEEHKYCDTEYGIQNGGSDGYQKRDRNHAVR